MQYLNEKMQAVVIIACEKHAPTLLDKLKECPEGNWFAMPPAATCRTGYWPHVSEAHSSHGCAIMGFAEAQTLARVLNDLSSANADGSLCPDCVAYEWDITPSHIAATANDPVCHRSVMCSNAYTYNYDGEMFCFCSLGCRDEFRQSPQKYLSVKPPAAVVAAK
jgi:YHS domain-containing protein